MRGNRSLLLGSSHAPFPRSLDQLASLGVIASPVGAWPACRRGRQSLFSSRLLRRVAPRNDTKLFVFVSLILLLAFPSGAGAADTDSAFFEKLLPLHQVKKSSGPYGWIAQHPEEAAQSFAEYVTSHPVIPDEKRRNIYITLLGDVDDKSREVITQTAGFIEVYFGLPVKWTAPVPLAAIPDTARRVHPQTRDKQILSTYVIDQVLKPMLPPDAFCLIAFTSSDLWPGEGWNFVFGQASPEDRVGVWSIYRNGNPNAGPDEYKVCLKRTIKTGTHEIGHMFSLPHCVYFECAMNGSNYRKEADARPLWLCPVCLRKLQWAVKFDVVDRYQRLAEGSRVLGLEDEAEFYRKAVGVLK